MSTATRPAHYPVPLSGRAVASLYAMWFGAALAIVAPAASRHAVECVGLALVALVGIVLAVATMAIVVGTGAVAVYLVACIVRRERPFAVETAPVPTTSDELTWDDIHALEALAALQPGDLPALPTVETAAPVPFGWDSVGASDDDVGTDTPLTTTTIKLTKDELVAWQMPDEAPPAPKTTKTRKAKPVKPAKVKATPKPRRTRQDRAGKAK